MSDGTGPSLLDLTRAQQTVLDYLSCLRNNRNETVVSIRELARLTGVPRSCVHRALDQLNDLRLIRTIAGSCRTTGAHVISDHVLVLQKPAAIARAAKAGRS